MKELSKIESIVINGTSVEKKSDGKFFIIAFSQNKKDLVFWTDALLKYSNENKSDHKTGNGSDVSRMLYELEWEHDITVGGISCDMWMGISLKHSEYELIIECDNAEYGFLCGVLLAREIDKQQK